MTNNHLFELYIYTVHQFNPLKFTNVEGLQHREQFSFTDTQYFFISLYRNTISCLFEIVFRLIEV